MCTPSLLPEGNGAGGVGADVVARMTLRDAELLKSCTASPLPEMTLRAPAVVPPIVLYSAVPAVDLDADCVGERRRPGGVRADEVGGHHVVGRRELDALTAVAGDHVAGTRRADRVGPAV